MTVFKHTFAVAAGLVLAAAALISCSEDDVNSVLYGTWNRESITITRDGVPTTDESAASMTFNKNGKVHFTSETLDTTWFYTYNTELEVLTLNTTGYVITMPSSSEMILDRSATSGDPAVEVTSHAIYRKLKKE